MNHVDRNILKRDIHRAKQMNLGALGVNLKYIVSSIELECVKVFGKVIRWTRKNDKLPSKLIKQF